MPVIAAQAVSDTPANTEVEADQYPCITKG